MKTWSEMQVTVLRDLIVDADISLLGSVKERGLQWEPPRYLALVHLGDWRSGR